MTKDVIITGIPRSGSTFLCALLDRLPDVVALNETMNLEGLLAARDDARRVQIIADYLAQTRRIITQTGKAPRQRLAGSGDNMFLCSLGGGRKSAKVGSAWVEVGKNLPQGFTLALKHLNCFAALLPQLRGRFSCLALVRNPLATLASWHTLDHTLRHGRVAVAEALDDALAARLAGLVDARQRRLALLDWYYTRFTELLPPECIQRYEDIVDTNGGCLAKAVSPAGALPNLLDAPLESRNESRLYGAAEQACADAEALLRDPSHACWRVYEPSAVDGLLQAYRRNAKAPQACRTEAAKAVVNTANAHRPKVDFMIVGAQKCGTSALWKYLGMHPQVGMSSPKEAHLFSSPDYCSHWSARQIDERYARWFRHCPQADIRGEATPIYMYFPEVAGELKRYNPKLKIVVLLRDSAERAISNYYMEKARGTEKAPLWLALLAEPWRLRRCSDPRTIGSSARLHSYRARGLYSLQLRNLHRHFPRDQVLVIRTPELADNHQAVLRRIFGFLGVDEDVLMPRHVALSGRKLHGKRSHPVLSWLLRLSFLPERWRARGLYSL